MRPAGVLFDLDDTLLHRDRSLASYASRFARDFGTQLVDPDADAIAALVIERDNGGYGVAGSRFATRHEDIADALSQRLRWRTAPSIDDLLRHWATHLAAHSVEMPGASALLERLALAGIALGVVSNGTHASRAEVVAQLGLGRHLRTLVSSERAGMRKPDVRIFELAARELGVPADRCWFVGDHPVNDIQGARAAGMRAIWLAGFHRWPDGVAATTTIAALPELEALLHFTNA